jgi:hypothetical protein
MGKRKKKAAGEAPTSDCLLLCDDVLVSQGKHKHSLMGVISIVGVPELPAVLGGYVAYCRFSNVYAGRKLKFKLSRASTDETLLQMDAEFPAETDPIGVYTLILALPPFAVREPGRYIFGAYDDGVPIAESPIQIQTLLPATEEQR